MKIVLLLVSILLLSSCDVLQPEETPTAKQRRKLFQTLWYPYIFTIPEYTYKQTITDNQNGTLTLSNVEYEDYLGKRVSDKKEVLYQRCLQGQVYRITQNDCQGTGTKATAWGAQLYQWCPTNDRSCEDSNGNAISPASPAAKACADSNFQGKKWELHSYEDINFQGYRTSGHYPPLRDIFYSKLLNDSYNQIFQDYLSNNILYGVWYKVSVSYDTQKTWVDYSSSVDSSNKNKTYYTLCKEQK
jgi:hypothetical protein